MDLQMEIESPPNSALSFSNRLFEEGNSGFMSTSTPEPRSDSENMNSSRQVRAKAEVGGKKFEEGWKRGKSQWKKVRNGVFFALLFLVLLVLMGLEVRHWTRQEHLDEELAHLSSSEQQLELQKELLNSQEHHLEWQRNETQLRLEHIELQRKLMEHSRNENASMADQLEEAKSILEGCKYSLEETNKGYWQLQEAIWKKREDIQLMERQVRLQESHAQVQADLLGAHTQVNQTQWEKMVELGERVIREEGELKGLELIEEQLGMMGRTLNQTVKDTEGRIEAKKMEKKERESKLHKLEEEIKLVQLMNETQAAKSDLAKSLRDQLVQKNEQIQALKTLAYSQGKEEAVIRKIFVDSKQQGHVKELRKKEDQIGEMHKNILDLKAQLEEKQKAIDEAQRRLDRWGNCHYRHWC